MWADFCGEGRMWVSEDIDPSFVLVYTITMKDHQPNTMLMKSKARNMPFKNFVESYTLGKVYFENMNVKNITYEVIKMTIT